MGWILDAFEWDRHAAEKEYKRALELNPGHADTLLNYGFLLSGNGRHDEASANLVGQVFAGACTTRLETVAQDSSPLALGRVDPYYVRHPQVFRQLSSPIFSVYLGLRRPVHSLASTILRREWA